MTDPSPALGPKATSVTLEGEDDGFVIEPGYRGESDHQGTTRLVASVPTERLAEVHHALLGALGEPFGVLYRQKVDRQNPRPNGAPPKDFVGLELPRDRVLTALTHAAPLVYHDARCEVWVRGRHGDQVVLDADGVLYAYPDDPAFRDALDAVGLPERQVPIMADRDYVKHWFHASNDPLEDALIAALGLTPIAPRR